MTGQQHRKRAFAILAFPARDHIKQVNDGGDIFSHRDAGADMFGGARQDRVGGVEIEFQNLFDVARNKRAVIEMDVRLGIDDARNIIEILQGCTPVTTGFKVDDVGRCAARAHVHATVGDLQIVLVGLIPGS